MMVPVRMGVMVVIVHAAAGLCGVQRLPQVHQLLTGDETAFRAEPLRRSQP